MVVRKVNLHVRFCVMCDYLQCVEMNVHRTVKRITRETYILKYQMLINSLFPYKPIVNFHYYISTFHRYFVNDIHNYRNSITSNDC